MFGRRVIERFLANRLPQISSTASERYFPYFKSVLEMGAKALSSRGESGKRLLI